MASRWRWLTWLAPLAFISLLLGVAYYQDPDFWRATESLAQLARDAARAGDFPRAAALAQKAVKREPHHAGHAILQAEINLNAGLPKEALAAARRAAALAPEAPPPVKLQAMALEMLGQRQNALDGLAAFLQNHPDEPVILETAAGLAAQRHDDRPLAAAWYQRLYGLTHAPEVRRRLVDLLISLDRYQEAIPLQEEEAADGPHEPEALHRLALLHYWQRDYQAAAAVYARLLEVSAENAALRLEAAKAADAAQDDDQALRHYLWLYGRHQGDPAHALALARLWAKKGRHAEAVAVLAPIMPKQTDPEVRRWYALELLLVGDLKGAFREYNANWRQGDAHEETIVNLARLYAQKQQFGPAAQLWDEASRRRLISGELRWEAALTYSYARRFEDALEILQPLHHRPDKEPRLLLFTGQLHFYLKHWEPAAHYFRAYLESHPDDFEVRRQLAEVLSFEPDTRDAALEQYQQILKKQDDPALRLQRISLLLKDRRWQDAAQELAKTSPAADLRLLRDQAHLYLWLGDLENALKYYDLYLKQDPHDRRARLTKAQVLTYLGQTAPALDLLNRLRQELPQDPAVRVAAIEAYLGAKDYGKALALAQKELEPLPELSLNQRALVARCYFQMPEPQNLKKAADLALENLRHDRYHQPSLLILAAALPRLPRYEDLDRVMDRLPGIKVGSPEFAAALAYFDGQLGRHGGKLDYLLHVLGEYRRHKRPDNPGEFVGLAWLAMELGDKRTAADYARQALKLRPNDKNIANMLLHIQMARKDWGQALASLEKDSGNPQAPLEMARVYLIRGQYEGVKAVVAKIPEDASERGPALLLLAQAIRLEQQYPEALKVLEQGRGKIPPQDWLMEQARILEAQGDRGAVAVYDDIIRQAPDAQTAQVAKARRARATGDLAGARQAFTAALKNAPQDVELLNEFEDVRRQMRPQLASRGFPESRGQRAPEEALRPYQFAHRGRETPGLGLSNYFPAFVADVLPLVMPEALYFSDSNKLYGGVVRVSGSFWVTKVLPMQLGMEYREYNQNFRNVGAEWAGTTYYNHFSTRWRRAEASVGLGPLNVSECLKVSGEIIGRRYWKRVDQTTRSIVSVMSIPRIKGYQPTPIILPGPPNTFLVTQEDTLKESRNRVFGSLEVAGSLGPRTDAVLRYSRRDIYDQDACLFPRLYQSVIDLAKVPLLTYHQVDFSGRHQFRPGLNWRGNVGGAFFSDNNRRLTVHQELVWQPLRQPRMGLEFTPHYYLATYRHHNKGYFSPGEYHAFGFGVDFYRQFYRLPTLILQGAVQGVNQHGDWGPSLQGLAALEWELVNNFFANAHFFYFREYVDNYRLLTAGLSFRWRF